MKLTSNESIFCQALAMTSLIAELSNQNFLNSKYYKNLQFSNNGKNFREILDNTGLGNPATMQMFLYVLLVMPKEIFKNFDEDFNKKYDADINEVFSKLVIKVETTYNKESSGDLSTINFYRHTRNAVSHAKCFYETINNVSYVTFKDENPKDSTKYCKFKIKTEDVGKIFEKLQIQIMEFLNSQWSNR